MTIPHNYCVSCDEVCDDHPSVCTVCGSRLESLPESMQQSRERQLEQNRVSNSLAVPPNLIAQIRESTEQLSTLLQGLQRDVNTAQMTQQELLVSMQTLRESMEGGIPDHLLNPSTGVPEHGRPTAVNALKELTRIRLEKNTAFFHQAELTIARNEELRQPEVKLEGVPGEFGPLEGYLLKDAVLVVADPRTGKGGALSETCQNSIRQASGQSVVVYFERGDGVTFVQKAILAERAGANAVVIGNNQEHPWPYTMKDSKKEAEQLNLSIPVFMVKQRYGREILSRVRTAPKRTPVCSVCIKNDTSSRSCVICTDSFGEGQTVVRLPSCGHVFHDECATKWLERHNTCPYCRCELPTDDPEYEAERRRASTTNTEWGDFYR